MNNTITEIKQSQILILSDQVADIESLSKVLTAEGYVCSESRSTSRWEKLIAENSPDAVILDVAMSGMTGFDLLHELVRNYPQIPVIIATREINPKTIVECMRSGARDYLTKPFEKRDLIVSVNQAIEAASLESKINQYHNDLEHVIKDQKQEIREMFLGSIEGLVHALEFKDKYTAGHARRVADLSVAIGKEMQLDNQELDDLKWGALLHDVGKIAIETSVQNKPAGLTDVEYHHVMAHSLVGADIIRKVANQNILDIVLHHHDRYDGTGLYQTQGDQIPLGAKIVAVADSFDAMTSSRPYRPAMPVEKGLDEIKRCSGSQFDPAIVSVFEKIMAENSPKTVQLNSF